MDDPSKLYVNALASGLKVIRAFDSSHVEMNLTEIAKRSGISRSASQRMTYTLVKTGFLEKNPENGKYFLAATVLDAACAYLESHPLVGRGNVVLSKLSSETGETVNLTQAEGVDMMFICRFTSPSRLLVHMPIGKRIPMFCSSAGRMWLATRTVAECNEILDGSRFIKYTSQTKTDKVEILAEIERARQDGYAYCVNEYYVGDLAMAVPVFNEVGEASAVLQLSVRVVDWSVEDALREFIPRMKEAAGSMLKVMAKWD